MADPIWPEAMLPIPFNAVSAGVDGRLVRTGMESGYTRQRKRFDTILEQYSVSWIFSAEQFALFKSFFKYKIANGALYFTMGMRIDSGVLENHRVRFQGGKYSYANSDRYWTVNTTLECEDQPVMTESDYDDVADLAAHGLTPDMVFDMSGSLHTLVHTTLPSNA